MEGGCKRRIELVVDTPFTYPIPLYPSHIQTYHLLIHVLHRALFSFLFVLDGWLDDWLGGQLGNWLA